MALRKIGSWTYGPAVATVYRDSELQEYQVKLAVNGRAFPDATYFCDDKNDAMQTAKNMANRAAVYERDNAIALTVENSLAQLA